MSKLTLQIKYLTIHKRSMMMQSAPDQEQEPLPSTGSFSSSSSSTMPM